MYTHSKTLHIGVLLNLVKALNTVYHVILLQTIELHDVSVPDCDQIRFINKRDAPHYYNFVLLYRIRFAFQRGFSRRLFFIISYGLCGVFISKCKMCLS